MTRHFYLKAIYVAFLFLITSCVEQSHLTYYRNGDYPKIIAPECIEDALNQSGITENIGHKFEEYTFDGKDILRHHFSYNTKGNENKITLFLLYGADQKTNFYHQILIKLGLNATDEKTELLKEKKLLVEVEKQIGTSCEILGFERIMKDRMQ